MYGTYNCINNINKKNIRLIINLKSSINIIFKDYLKKKKIVKPMLYM